ncbi:hypothetical protein GYMLUDRAFT_752883 [Collybiopsis luxurians FD-317 M1]|uniref:Uncharacterized protein n=1 Tax=Collybiopsis luxurians FD-317 M1 TaxID=944289 RepID=A0A0D0BQV7_9AGAR|nr:hypothetical protein GYMLUDRAFT_752883 [Collybiopsis luxurians FD-317 M1]
MLSWPSAISLLLSDYIVSWRAWMLFQHNRRVKLALIFLMVVNVGLNIASCIWADVEIHSLFSFGSFFTWLPLIPSLMVNIYATLLIALKAWKYRQLMIQLELPRTMKSRAQTVMLLLIESGAVFCAIQFAFTALCFVETYFETGIRGHVGFESCYTDHFYFCDRK